MIFMAEHQGSPDIWEKWAWFWNAIFYIAAIGAFILTLQDRNRSASIWLTGLLTLLLLLWHWAGFKLAYKDLPSWNERTLARFILIVGDIIFWFVLVNISPAYYLTLFGLFGQVFRHLPIRYATTAVLFLTAATIFEQLADVDQTFTLTNPTIWLFLFMGLAGIFIGIWITAIIEQSAQRRQLIEQLEAAQNKLAAAERREGVLEERQRLAGEIHDTLAQGFTSIIMHLEAAEQAMATEPDRLQWHLNRARSTARASLDQARRVVQGLRPDQLERHSLPEAIARTARHWGEETGVQIASQTTGSPIPLHPKIEVTLLRAAQEALNNVRKYARAKDVRLTLSYMEDVVMLDVQDDGVGLQGSEPSSLSGGFGLQAMRERAQQCGGSVMIESEPGEGTTVVVNIPLIESATKNDSYTQPTGDTMVDQE
jgi:signal transduction histidine kinase